VEVIGTAWVSDTMGPDCQSPRERSVICPRCSSDFVWRSRRRWWDLMLTMFAYWPYRC